MPIKNEIMEIAEQAKGSQVRNAKGAPSGAPRRVPAPQDSPMPLVQPCIAAP